MAQENRPEKKPLEQAPPEYKRVLSKAGRVMWYMDGKLTAAKWVPDHIKEELTEEAVEEVTEDIVEEVKKPVSKACVICDGPWEHSRRVMIGENVYEAPLCGNCYEYKTLGEVHGAIKKRGLYKEEE